MNILWQLVANNNLVRNEHVYQIQSQQQPQELTLLVKGDNYTKDFDPPETYVCRSTEKLFHMIMVQREEQFNSQLLTLAVPRYFSLRPHEQYHRTGIFLVTLWNALFPGYPSCSSIFVQIGHFLRWTIVKIKAKLQVF